MKHPLTIVHPFDPWGSKVGGIEGVVRSLLRHAPEDFSVSLIGVTEDPAARPAGEWASLHFEGAPVRFYPLFPVREPNKRTWTPLFLRFALRLRHSRIDLREAVLFGHRVEPIALAGATARARVLFVHSDPRDWIGSGSEVRWRLVPWAYRWMESAAVRKADRTFAVTRGAAEYLQSRYPEKKGTIFFMPSAYREEVFHSVPAMERESARRKLLANLSVSEPARLVLFAGRMERQKNPVLAVQTLARLRASGENAHLLMAGEGSLIGDVKAEIERGGLGGHVHLLGSLNAPALAGAMHAADAFLLTSRYEGMPVAVMEAMACGLPVVATDTGEVRALVQDGVTGRVVPDPTAEALALALREVLSHPERYPSDACAQGVRPYRTETVMEKIYEHLRQVVDEKMGKK